MALTALTCQPCRARNLTSLTCLRHLSCHGMCSVDDIGPLTALRGLESLDLNVTSLEHVSVCSRLQVLNCTSLPLSDLSPLTALQSLRHVECRTDYVFNEYTPELGPLSSLTRLTFLSSLSHLTHLNC